MLDVLGLARAGNGFKERDQLEVQDGGDCRPTIERSGGRNAAFQPADPSLGEPSFLADLLLRKSGRQAPLSKADAEPLADRERPLTPAKNLACGSLATGSVRHSTTRITGRSYRGLTGSRRPI